MHPCLRFPAPLPRKFLCRDLRGHAPSPSTALPQLLPRTLCPSSISDDGAEDFPRVGSGVQLQ